MFRLKKYNNSAEREIDRQQQKQNKIARFNSNIKNSKIDKKIVVANIDSCKRESIVQEMFFIVIAFRSFCVFINIKTKTIFFLKKLSSLLFIFKDCFNCLLKLLIIRSIIELFRLSICCFKIEIVRRICEFISLLLLLRQASTFVTKKMY